MPDEVKPGEMPETQETTPSDSGAGGDAGELERTRAALKKANAEAATNRKRLEALEKAEEDRNLANASELEKAQLAAKKADEKAEAALKTANDRLLRAAFIAEAAKHGAKIPADAYALAIADGAQVSIDDKGEALGVAEAVKALVDAGRLPMSGRPGAPGLDAGAGGQTRPEKTVTLTEEQKMFARVSGMTEEQYIKYLTAPSEPFKQDTGGQ